MLDWIRMCAHPRPILLNSSKWREEKLFCPESFFANLCDDCDVGARRHHGDVGLLPEPLPDGRRGRRGGRHRPHLLLEFISRPDRLLSAQVFAREWKLEPEEQRRPGDQQQAGVVHVRHLHLFLCSQRWAASTIHYFLPLSLYHYLLHWRQQVTYLKKYCIFDINVFKALYVIRRTYYGSIGTLLFSKPGSWMLLGRIWPNIFVVASLYLSVQKLVPSTTKSDCHQAAKISKRTFSWKGKERYTTHSGIWTHNLPLFLLLSLSLPWSFL